jgi:hypothetical protein
MLGSRLLLTIPDRARYLHDRYRLERYAKRFSAQELLGRLRHLSRVATSLEPLKYTEPEPVAVPLKVAEPELTLGWWKIKGRGWRYGLGRPDPVALKLLS